VMEEMRLLTAICPSVRSERSQRSSGPRRSTFRLGPPFGNMGKRTSPAGGVGHHRSWWLRPESSRSGHLRSDSWTRIHLVRMERTVFRIWFAFEETVRRQSLITPRRTPGWYASTSRRRRRL